MPQWNCSCRNCQAARDGTIPPQTQSSVAISADGRHWFLINASPDIRAQFEAFAALHPDASSPRNSPLQAILLTNADLDHTAGLLFLREGDPLHLHATRTVREYLAKELAFTSILTAFCGVVWHELPFEEWRPLPLRDGQPSGLAYRAISLPSPPPLFGSAEDSPEGQTCAFVFRDEQTGQELLVAPDVFEITPALDEALRRANAVLFDGTFWSQNELEAIRPTARPASAMGHLPIANGSLEILSQLSARQRIYLHINNTNPIFLLGSNERQAVEKAGIVIGRDGLEFDL